MKQEVGTSPKYQRIVDDICRRLRAGEWGAGQPLPPQTELIGQYDVSHGTIRQVLQQLQAQGLVWSRRGKGTFAKEQPVLTGKADRSGVGLVVFDSPNRSKEPILDDLALPLQRALAEHGLEVSLGVFEPDEVGAAVAWGRRHGGVLAYGMVPDSFLAGCVNLNLPTLLIGVSRDSKLPAACGQVTTDDNAMLDMAVQFLCSLNHERLVFINRSTTLGMNPAYAESLTRAYQRSARLRLPEGAAIEISLGDEHDGDELVLRTIRRHAATAVIIEGAIRSCRLIRQLEQAGLRIPEDLSVLALGAVAKRHLSVPDLTRIQAPTLEIGRRAAQIMTVLMGSRLVPRQFLACELIWGSTCARVSHLILT